MNKTLIPRTLLNNLRFAALVTLTAASSITLTAGAPKDPLAYLPEGAAAVGRLQFNDLKSSPLTREIFDGFDALGADGDAARFLADAGLKPQEDFDAITLAVSPKALSPDGGHGDESVLLVLEGRFDTDRLSRAITTRGAVAKTAGTQAYFQLKENNSEGVPEKDCKGAVAFVSNRITLVGSEPAVIEALTRQGATNSLIARHAALTPAGATGWLLVDVSRIKKDSPAAAPVKDGPAEPKADQQNGSDSPDKSVRAMAGLMKSVTLFSTHFTVERSQVRFGVTGLVADAQVRQDIEDMLRGLTAAWRIAVQDKEPELIPIIRAFRIVQNDTGVSLTGTVPGSYIEKLKGKQKMVTARKGGPEVAVKATDK